MAEAEFTVNAKINEQLFVKAYRMGTLHAYRRVWEALEEGKNPDSLKNALKVLIEREERDIDVQP
jgi:hypothetical protein